MNAEDFIPYRSLAILVAAARLVHCQRAPHGARVRADKALIARAVLTGGMVVSLTLADAGAAPTKTSAIFWKCSQPDTCEVQASAPDGATIPVFNGPVRSPVVSAHGPFLREFRMSCGSPCQVSIFVDLQNKRVSRPFQNVVAVDGEQSRAAVAGLHTVDILSLFTPRPAISVKRDFAPAAALVSVIQEAEFKSPGRLRLRYQRGPRYESVEEVVSVSDQPHD